MESPSASDAAMVPIDVWFSSALCEVDEEKTGELSFKLLIATATFWYTVCTPSYALTVIE